MDLTLFYLNLSQRSKTFWWLIMAHRIQNILKLLGNQSGKMTARNRALPGNTLFYIFNILFVCFLFEGESAKEKPIEAHSQWKQICLKTFLTFFLKLWSQIVSLIYEVPKSESPSAIVPLQVLDIDETMRDIMFLQFFQTLQYISDHLQGYLFVQHFFLEAFLQAVAFVPLQHYEKLVCIWIFETLYNGNYVRVLYLGYFSYLLVKGVNMAWLWGLENDQVHISTVWPPFGLERMVLHLGIFVWSS